MKKLTLFLSAVIMLSLSATTAMAQYGGGQRNGGQQGQQGQQGQRQRMSYAERQEQRLTQLTKDLSLTEDQVTKAKELNKKYDKKMTDMRNQATTPEERQAQRGKFREVMDEYNKEFKALLTDEQKVKYDKIIEERRQRFNRQGPPNGERPQRGNRTN
ncbi:Spy/CpxP family protein refolding chaperone [Saccharicrinis sp. FJH2]|uniref:Spy/CpxP family protein refolding chaperone n=1 Tax=Saccharicrinis sp. FJH65 TaxID=3344659 RepID=UPI0035F4A866